MRECCCLLFRLSEGIKLSIVGNRLLEQMTLWPDPTVVFLGHGCKLGAGVVVTSAPSHQSYYQILGHCAEVLSTVELSIIAH